MRTITSLRNIITLSSGLKITKPLCMIPRTCKFTKDLHIFLRQQTPAYHKFMQLTNKQFKMLKRNKTTIKIEEKPSKAIYSRLWILEQLMNFSLLALIPAAFMTDSKEIDMAMAATVVAHGYSGVESMLVDYARSKVVGKAVSKFLAIFVLGISAATMAGFYKLIYDDIGLANYLKKLWQIKVKQPNPESIEKPTEVKQNKK